MLRNPGSSWPGAGSVASHGRSQSRLKRRTSRHCCSSRRRSGRSTISDCRSVRMTGHTRLPSLSGSVSVGPEAPADPRSRSARGFRSVECGNVALEPSLEILAEVLAITGDLHDGLEVVELVTGVIAGALEHDSVDTVAVRRSGELLQGVGELHLVAAAGPRGLEDIEDLRGQHIAADDGEVRRGDRKSTRLNSSHVATSYDVFCLT